MIFKKVCFFFLQYDGLCKQIITSESIDTNHIRCGLIQTTIQTVIKPPTNTDHNNSAISTDSTPGQQRLQSANPDHN